MVIKILFATVLVVRFVVKMMIAGISATSSLGQPW